MPVRPLFGFPRARFATPPGKHALSFRSLFGTPYRPKPVPARKAPAKVPGGRHLRRPIDESWAYRMGFK